MPKIIIKDRSGHEHDVDVGDMVGHSLMEIIRDSGAEEILAVCGGCCSCSTCHIYIDEGDWSRLPRIGVDEDDLLDATDCRGQFSRLSCQVIFVDEMDGLRFTVAPEI